MPLAITSDEVTTLVAERYKKKQEPKKRKTSYHGEIQEILGKVRYAFTGVPDDLPKDSEWYKLQKRLATLGLKIVDNSGGGNCLFEAVGSQIDQDAKSLRALTVSCLKPADMVC